VPHLLIVAFRFINLFNFYIMDTELRAQGAVSSITIADTDAKIYFVFVLVLQQKSSRNKK